ncbi:MAG: ATP phosphoribosyltransferase [Chloroflexi bacterium]|nr:MAG: ATP phosphoribosyltransferase [Chloroflexota bacterium]
MQRNDVRLALPSKGLMQTGAMEFLETCGLKVFRPNPRQYMATIPNLPGLTVVFQRPGDIVVSVSQGGVDFGITGLDTLAEKGANNGNNSILTLHDELGFGPCSLNLAVPEDTPIHTMADLRKWAQTLVQNGRYLRVATKFPHLTGQFLNQHNVHPYKLIPVEGTLEIAPAIGYADIISDLVSSGTTLRDNHLRPIQDGKILQSQACLIANYDALKQRPEVLKMARQLLEIIEAHQRAENSYMITANVRGDSPETIARRMFNQTSLGGLQGPTIAPIITRQHNAENTGWFAVTIVVARARLFRAINELRAIGGSGVIVTPVTYIFEEEPARYQAMLKNLNREEPEESER